MVCYVAKSFEMWFYVIKLIIDLIYGWIGLEIWFKMVIIFYYSLLEVKKKEWFYQSFLYWSFVILFGKSNYYYKERLIGFYEHWMFKKVVYEKRSFVHELHVILLLLPLD